MGWEEQDYQDILKKEEFKKEDSRGFSGEWINFKYL